MNWVKFDKPTIHHAKFVHVRTYVHNDDQNEKYWYEYEKKHRSIKKIKLLLVYNAHMYTQLYEILCFWDEKINTDMFT